MKGSKPDNNKATPPPAPVDGKIVKFSIAAYFAEGGQRRVFNGEARLLEGESKGLDEMIRATLESIRNEGQMPAGMERLEIAAEVKNF